MLQIMMMMKVNQLRGEFSFNVVGRRVIVEEFGKW